MALTYDLTRCAIADPWDDENKDLTESLIFGCIGTGIGTLTRDNLPEYRARMIVGGFWLKGDDGYPTIADLLPYVGLRTNVFPEESRAKWLKRVVGYRLDELVREGRVPA
jgi:hypothetical protein